MSVLCNINLICHPYNIADNIMSLSSLSNINVFNTLVLNAGPPSTLSIGGYKQWSMYNPYPNSVTGYPLSAQCYPSNCMFNIMINNGLTSKTADSVYLTDSFNITSTRTDTSFAYFNGDFFTSMTGFTGKAGYIHSGDGSFTITATAGVTNTYIMQFPFFLAAKTYTIGPRAVTSGTTYDFNLYGSNDGTNYTLLVTNNGIVMSTNFAAIRPDMTTTMGYKYYKFVITNLNYNLNLSLFDLTGTIVITQP